MTTPASWYSSEYTNSDRAIMILLAKIFNENKISKNLKLLDKSVRPTVKDFPSNETAERMLKFLKKKYPKEPDDTRNIEVKYIIQHLDLDVNSPNIDFITNFYTFKYSIKELFKLNILDISIDYYQDIIDLKQKRQSATITRTYINKPCVSCKQKTVYNHIEQKRSLDEGFTSTLICASCGKKVNKGS
jgi:DNA-directed RNA polymerase subunit M/transcription elongation factor TFIIS